MNVLISVIITTYNRSELLIRSLKSALNQSFSDFEVIVVDDASCDDTYSVLTREFAAEVEKGLLVYHKNACHRERGYSRNMGMELAKGKYIAFLDDDDEWLPNHLSVLAGYLENNPGVGCIFSNSTLCYHDGHKRTQRKQLKTGSGRFYRDLSICGQMDSPPLSLFRKEAYNSVGGFLNPPLEDWEFFSRLAMNFDVAYIDQVTCLVNVPEESHLKYPPVEYALREEEVLSTIIKNLQLYGYSLSARMLGGAYFKLAYDIFPIQDKSQAYLQAALKHNKMLVFHTFTWKVVFRRVFGNNVYNSLKELFSKRSAETRV